MILSRAPLRISFVGGGTDLPSYYRKEKQVGRVISVTFDKYVYVAVNRTPFINKVSARYSVSETVDHPADLKHTRIKAALLDLEIFRNIEIASFADLPAKAGLGSSSSFTVALLQALYLFKNMRLTSEELASAACRLEMNLINEPIGKQDQFAAVYGGFNVFQFNPDETVSVTPLHMKWQAKFDLEDHFLLFFMGLVRNSSSVLNDQNANVSSKLETLKEMADSVFEFRENLLASNIRRLGEMLHQGWLKKRSLSSQISNSVIDDLYGAGMDGGAWGGKVLGAGGGGCLAFITSNKDEVRLKVSKMAKDLSLTDFREIPVKFVQEGASVHFNR